MIEMHWPEALDPGEPDMAAAHLRARQITSRRRRRAGVLFSAVAAIAALLVIVPVLSARSPSADLAAPPGSPAPAEPGGPVMTIAPNPDNTPSAAVTREPGAVEPGPSVTGTVDVQISCYGGPIQDDPPVLTVQSTGRGFQDVCGELWATGELGDGPVPESFLTCRAADGSLAVFPALTPKVCSDNGMDDIAAVPDDLQDLDAGDFGPYVIGFTGNQFGYPADWDLITLTCGQPPVEAIRIAPPGTPLTCDLSALDSGLLALPADNWPPAPQGAETVSLGNVEATVTTEGDGALTYRFDTIGLVMRVRDEQHPDLIQAILDSVDSDQPPPSAADPAFDTDLGARITQDLLATLPAPLEPQQTTAGLSPSFSLLEARRSDSGALVSAHLYAVDFATEVARHIPSNCPPLTITFRAACGQLVDVRGNRIAILPRNLYYHAFVEAPGGHVLNVVVQRAPEPGSPYALPFEEALQWLSSARSLLP